VRKRTKASTQGASGTIAHLLAVAMAEI